MLRGLLAAVVMSGLALGACGGDADDASTPTPARELTVLERLTAAYGDSAANPSAEAWQALLDDPGYETQSIAVVEFVRLTDGGADAYNAFLDALVPAVAAGGGTMISINDILFPGLEGLDDYEGGASWVAEFPSIRAYVDALLDPAVVATAAGRSEAVEEAQILAGPNLLPEVIRQLGPNDVASDYPSDRVQGKSADEIIAELLAIYPSGGADPTEATLRRMIALPGFQDQRVHFINLYRFNEGGEASLGEYNAAALPSVLAHGARPKALVNITHRLAGPTAWDRFIFVAWPSLAVFTDLRLDPSYIEAQESRVVSGEEYGNLINIARADR